MPVTSSVPRMPRHAKAMVACLGVLAAMVLSMGLATNSARASSSGCTGVSDGYTCFYIYGSGTYVDKFVQARGKAGGWPAICNYKARFTASWYGVRYWEGWSSYHSGCFYTYRATRTLYVRKNYTDNTYACGSWYENGSRLGTACNWIHR